MKLKTMGSGAAAGITAGHANRVFTWFWHAWLEAQAEIPLLRWLALAALFAAGLAVYLAAAEGKTILDVAVYGMLALLFVLNVPVIFYLLFEVYRKHRSDAIFDSHRLTSLIRRISQEEIARNADAKTAPEDKLLLLRSGRAGR